VGVRVRVGVGFSTRMSFVSSSNDQLHMFAMFRWTNHAGPINTGIGPTMTGHISMNRPMRPLANGYVHLTPYYIVAFSLRIEAAFFISLPFGTLSLRTSCRSVCATLRHWNLNTGDPILFIAHYIYASTSLVHVNMFSLE
jgi:hypothetical protein